MDEKFGRELRAGCFMVRGIIKNGTSHVNIGKTSIVEKQSSRWLSLLKSKLFFCETLSSPIKVRLIIGSITPQLL